MSELNNQDASQKVVIICISESGGEYVCWVAGNSGWNPEKERGNILPTFVMWGVLKKEQHSSKLLNV